jgi:hypothetical protein
LPEEKFFLAGFVLVGEEDGFRAELRAERLFGAFLAKQEASPLSKMPLGVQEGTSSFKGSVGAFRSGFKAILSHNQIEDNNIIS